MIMILSSKYGSTMVWKWTNSVKFCLFVYFAVRAERAATRRTWWVVWQLFGLSQFDNDSHNIPYTIHQNLNAEKLWRPNSVGARMLMLCRVVNNLIQKITDGLLLFPPRHFIPTSHQFQVFPFTHYLALILCHFVDGGFQCTSNVLRASTGVK